MNENLNVNIKVSTSGATAQLQNTANQVKSLSTSSNQASESLKQAQRSLNSLKTLSIGNLATSILTISGKLRRINKDIKDMTGGFKGLFSIATDKEYIAQSGRFGALTGALEHAVDGVKTGFKGVAETIKNSCIPAIAKLALITGTIAAAVKLIKNAINVAAKGDEIKDESQKLHLNTTAYQEWGYVMEQNGVDISALKTGMRQFSKEVANGGDKLKKYGIYSNDVSEAFEQSIYTIQNMSSETEKIAAMTELFGNRASELYPVLNMTNAETKDLMNTYRSIGGTMSNELVAASDKLTDSITAMKSAWQGLKNTLAVQLIPVIQKVVEWLTVLFAKASILIKTLFGIEETFGGSVDASASVASNMEETEKSAAKISKYLASFDELNIMTSNKSDDSSSGIDTSDLEDTTSSTLINNKMLEQIDKFKEKISTTKGLIETCLPIFTTAAGLIAILLGHPVLGCALLGMSLGEVVGLKFFNEMNDKVKLAVAGLTLGAGLALILLGHPIAGATLLGISLGAALSYDWSGWASKIKEDWANVKTGWKECCQTIKAEWEGVKKKLGDYTANVKVKLATKWADLKTSWNNLLSNFKDKVCKISLKFSASAADLKNWINTNVIAKVNSAFSKVALLKNVKIPLLANGGVIKQPTIAMMGEYAGASTNPEIAAPRSAFQEMLAEGNEDLAETFISIGRQIISAIENNDMTVQIGDDVIARSAQRGNQSYKNRTGSPLWAY